MFDLLLSVASVGFVGLTALSVWNWFRRRDRANAILSLAFGSVSAVLIISSRFDSIDWLMPLVLLLFLGSGYAFLEFRGVFVPIGRRWIWIARGLAVGAGLLATAGFVIADLTNAGEDSPLQMAGWFAVAGVWCLLVGDAVYKLWAAGRHRPAVQSARLRSLAAGLMVLILVLFFSFGLTLVPSLERAADSATGFVMIGSLPLLWMAFAPPRWLRTWWSAGETEKLSLAIRELLLFSPNAEVLAERALAWALRLVGAEAGYITGSLGEILATTGISADEAATMNRGLKDPSDRGDVVELVDGTNHSAVAVPLYLEQGTGRLVVLAGRLTPFFGADEVSRLSAYSTMITAGIDRTRLVQAMRELNADLELRVNERTAELQATNNQLTKVDGERKGLLRRVVTAQEEERERIAQDLHDDAVQVMTAVNMKLSTLRARMTDDADREAAQRLEKTVALSIARLRNLVFELSPPELERSGLAAAIRRRLEIVSEESAQTSCEVRDSLDDHLDPETRILLYRIAQEAIVNAQKHAGATHIRVDLARDDGGVLVRVSDDGSGFSRADRETERGHLGLAAMRERAEMAGGWWKLNSLAGMGTTVEFWVPVETSTLAASA